MNPALTFSQRNGIELVENSFQREFVSERARTQIWNFLYAKLFANSSGEVYGFLHEFWMEFLCEPLDEQPHLESIVTEVKKVVFTSIWNKLFDLIEFIAAYNKTSIFPIPLPKTEMDALLSRGFGMKELSARIFDETPVLYDNLKVFTIALNEILEKENSAYRIVGGFVQEITSQIEIEEIQNAFDNNPYKPCRDHLAKALSFMSDRENPCYRNSIKESISAVEAVAKIVANSPNATLGDILKDKGSNDRWHSQFKVACKNLYAWTNGSDGIRHAMMDEPNLKLADARFMLVTCSAFVNFLIDAYKDCNIKERQ